jgi:MFS family permease
VWVQWLLFLQSFVLALLSFTGWIAPWHIVAISACFGVLNAVDTPMRHSLIGSLVNDKRDLPNAIALNAVVYNAARFVAPPIAGALLGLTSEALCFLLNALSYLAIGLALQRMQLTYVPRKVASLGNSFGEGVRFALATRPVRALLALTLLLNISASSYVVMVPILAKQVYGGGAETLGILLGASGCGALASTAYLAWQKASGHLAGNVFKGWLVVSAGIAVLTFTGWLPFGMAAACALGFGLSMANVATNASLMSSVPDALRGRMISYYTAIRFGMDAVGGLIAGALVSGFGLRPTLIAETVAVLAGMTWLLLRRSHLYGDLARLHTASAKPQAA